MLSSESNGGGDREEVVRDRARVFIVGRVSLECVADEQVKKKRQSNTHVEDWQIAVWSGYNPS